MGDIDNGALSFKAIIDNGQMDAAVEETLRRVQGLSSGTVAGGQKMDAAFNHTADSIRGALGQIGVACEMHEQSLQSLTSEYQRLGQQAGAAFMAGRDEEYQAITQQQAAIKGEITVRERLLQELREQSDELEKAAQKQEENRQKTEANANAQVSMRTRIKELREEMMLLVDQGIDEQSEAYQRLKNELGRLIDIQSDVAQQGRTLANDEQKFQGIITGLSGLAGGFSAVTGAVSLFAGENEDLQKIMVKVQSVMAITMGLQQVAQTLNKDSAFQLVTLNSLKEWWTRVVAKATIVETAETIATGANTVAKKANSTANIENVATETADTAAKGANTIAAKTGTLANMGLAGAFRMVGAAIKSIPVFGWIIAGVSALVGLVVALTRESRKAAKETKEMNAAIVEGSYKAIGSVQNLSAQWAALGDNLEAKKKFIEQNKKALDELGDSINSVAKAEKLLANGAQAFIDAQIAKAKAAAILASSEKWVKQSIEADLELEQANKNPRVTMGTNGGVGGVYSHEIDNPEIKKAEDKKKEATEKLKAIYAEAAKFTAESLEEMKKVGLDGQDEIDKGTIAWYEKQISDKQAHLKTLSVLDEAGIKATKKQIDDYQKIIDNATGKKPTGGSSNSPKDPFLEKLEERKKRYDEYFKWVNNGLQKEAQSEFAGLLENGETYKEYLQGMLDSGKLTKEQIYQITNEIAGETDRTMLDTFKASLEGQLKDAKTVIDQLNIIQKMRDELKNSNDPLKAQKEENLDEAEKNAIQKQKEETDALMDEYASYLDQRVKLHQKYLDDIALLEKRKKDAKTPEEAAQVQRTIDNRTKQYDIDKKGTGDGDYDAMVQQYATFEQKKQSIIDEYDAKRKKAAEMAEAFQKELEQATTDEQRAEMEKRISQNNELQESIKKNENKDIEKLTVDDLMESDTWNQLFGNLDNLTASKMIELRNKVESEWSKLNLSPEQLEALRNKMGEVTNQIEEKNPFAALADAIKRYKAGEKDVSFKDIAKNAGASIDLVKGSFDAVVGGMEKMGVQMDEETQAIIGDIGGILEGASQLANGIAAGNPLAIIQGSIGLLTSAFDLFNSRDRKAEKSIRKHKENIEALEKAYNRLEWAIDKALGGAVYKNQKAAIANMEEQRRNLQAMWKAEESKKKTDPDKVNEYKDQYEQLGRDIQDMLDEIATDILQTDAKSFANELGDALAQAFGKGEDAAKAFEDVVNNVMRNAVLNQLKKRFLEQQLQGALDSLEKSMGYWNGGDFIFDGLTDAEIADFKNKVAAISSNFNQALGIYSDLFKDLGLDKEDDSSLTGAVKGMSEESASIVAGQMNAIRINQMESTAILRQQLASLSAIANNTSYNFHLAKLDRIVSLLESVQSSGSLRSQGLL